MSSDLYTALAQARREKASTKKQRMTAEEKAQLKTVFDLFDADGGGSIDALEMKTVMKALGFNITKQQVEQMIAEIDIDGNGTVDFQEFLELLEGASSLSDPQTEWKKAFTLFTGGTDVDAITPSHIARVAQEAGMEMSDDQIMAMLDLADQDESGDVDLTEFLHIMRKTGLL